MNIQRLKYFIVVAEELHFGRAARRLHLDQGALSNSIRRLERDLGVRLFERSSRHVEITRAGAALLIDARDVIASADRLMRTVAEHRLESHEEFVVGLFFGEYAAADLTAPIMVMFGHRHPAIRLKTMNLSQFDQVSAVGDGRVDVAIVRPPCEDPRVTLIPIVEESRVVVFGDNSPLSDVSSLRSADLELLYDRKFPEIIGAPADLNAFCLLADHWDVSHLRREGIGAGSSALRRFLADSDTALVSAESWYRTAVPQLSAAVLCGVAGSQIALAHRTGPVDERVSAFVACACDVARQLIGLIPSARALV